MNLKKIFFVITIILNTTISYTQPDNIVRITNTQILVPDMLDFGTVNEEEKFMKILIRNERNNCVKIQNIIVPQGISLSIDKKNFPAKSQTPVYIGINPAKIQDTGTIHKNIIIQTNLILPIKLNVYAKINKKD